MIGIIANPSSGKDIRRLVSQGTVFDNAEKTNIIQRILYVLHNAGVHEICMMPDAYQIGRRAVDNLLKNHKIQIDLEMLDINYRNSQEDSTEAAGILRERGASCIITLGGDGTNRAVAKSCGNIPLIPISTGTNNVFPLMLEGTVAGLAAVVAERDVNKFYLQLDNRKKLDIYKNGELVDIALIDAAVTSELFVGARALWEPERIKELVVTEARIASLGMSAIAGSITTVSRAVKEGIYLTLNDTPKIESWVPIMPGIIKPVVISDYKKVYPGQRIKVITECGMVALDGEREVAFNKEDLVEISLSYEGLDVINVTETLDAAVKGNFFNTEGGGYRLNK